MPKKRHFSVRYDEKTYERLVNASALLGVDRSTLNRWIVESWLETVDDEEDPPNLPAVTALARSLLKGKKPKHK